MSELKECPFCGTVPKPKPSKDECWWHECGCRTVIINYEEWNTRPIEDGLRAELARRDEKIKELRNDISGYRRTVLSQHEIIRRLKEDGEKLINSFMFDESHWRHCPYCKSESNRCEGISHSPDCPITLHRALMKELE